MGLFRKKRQERPSSANGREVLAPTTALQCEPLMLDRPQANNPSQNGRARVTSFPTSTLPPPAQRQQVGQPGAPAPSATAMPTHVRAPSASPDLKSSPNPNPQSRSQFNPAFAVAGNVASSPVSPGTFTATTPISIRGRASPDAQAVRPQVAQGDTRGRSAPYVVNPDPISAQSSSTSTAAQGDNQTRIDRESPLLANTPAPVQLSSTSPSVMDDRAERLPSPTRVNLGIMGSNEFCSSPSASQTPNPPQNRAVPMRSSPSSSPVSPPPDVPLPPTPPTTPYTAPRNPEGQAYQAPPPGKQSKRFWGSRSSQQPQDGSKSLFGSATSAMQGALSSAPSNLNPGASEGGGKKPSVFCSTTSAMQSALAPSPDPRLFDAQLFIQQLGTLANEQLSTELYKRRSDLTQASFTAGASLVLPRNNNGNGQSATSFLIAIAQQAHAQGQQLPPLTSAQQTALKIEMLKAQVSYLEAEFERRGVHVPQKRMEDTLKGAGMGALRAGLKSGLLGKAMKGTFGNMNMNLNMPNVNLPNVNLPNLNLPNVDLPNIHIPDPLAAARADVDGVVNTVQTDVNGLASRLDPRNVVGNIETKVQQDVDSAEVFASRLDLQDVLAGTEAKIHQDVDVAEVFASHLDPRNVVANSEAKVRQDVNAMETRIDDNPIVSDFRAGLNVVKAGVSRARADARAVETDVKVDTAYVEKHLPNPHDLSVSEIEAEINALQADLDNMRHVTRSDSILPNPYDAPREINIYRPVIGNAQPTLSDALPNNLYPPSPSNPPTTLRNNNSSGEFAPSVAPTMSSTDLGANGGVNVSVSNTSSGTDTAVNWTGSGGDSVSLNYASSNSNNNNSGAYDGPHLNLSDVQALMKPHTQLGFQGANAYPQQPGSLPPRSDLRPYPYITTGTAPQGYHASQPQSYPQSLGVYPTRAGSPRPAPTTSNSNSSASTMMTTSTYPSPSAVPSLLPPSAPSAPTTPLTTPTSEADAYANFSADGLAKNPAEAPARDYEYHHPQGVLANTSRHL